MKISICLLLLAGMSLANATCPDGFYYDVNRKLCVNNNDPNVTAKKIRVCGLIKSTDYCVPID